MMGDVQHLVLFKTDFSNNENIKGNLIFKCPYRSILRVEHDKKDSKKLNLVLKSDEYQHFSEQRQTTIVNANNPMNDFSGGGLQH